MHERKTNKQVEEYVGNILINQSKVKATGFTSDYEDGSHTDIWWEDSKGNRHYFEVKTIKAHCRVTQNPRWRDMPDAWQGKRLWMLNNEKAGGTEKGGKDVKYQYLIDNGCGLVYVTSSGVCFYSCSMLKKATLGFLDYWCPKTTLKSEKTNNAYEWENKAVIDLDKGHWIECTPPDEFFKRL